MPLGSGRTRLLLPLFAVAVLAGCSSTSPTHPTATGMPTTAESTTVAVVRSGPAVLTSVAFAGAKAGVSLTLPGSPEEIVATPDGHQAFLLDPSDSEVIPVNLVNDTVGTPIQAGKLPTDEHLSPDGRTLYVTDNLGAALIPIDVASDTAEPVQTLTQGVVAYVPAPTGPTGVVSLYTASGQPGAIAFDSSDGGLGTILAVGTNPVSEINYSNDGKTVFVTESGVGSQLGEVIPVTVSSHAVGTPIVVGHGPDAATMSPDGRELLIANSLDSTVSVIDVATRRVVATVPVAADPASIRVAAKGTTAWVASTLGTALVPISLTTNRAGGAVALTNAPSDLAVAPSATSAWVLFPSSNGNVEVLNTLSNKLGSPIDVGNGPNLLIAHDQSTAWVANSLSNTVQHVNLAGRSVGAAIPVKQAPGALALTPNNKQLLVLSFGDGSQPGYLTEIDTATAKPGTPLAVGIGPSALSLTNDGSTAVVINGQSNSVSIVDVASWATRATVKLPCSPTDLAVTPDGTMAFVACTTSSQVFPITLGSGSLGAPIAVGSIRFMVMGNQGKLLFVDEFGEIQAISTATDQVTESQQETGNIADFVPTANDASLIAIDNSGADVVVIKGSTLATVTSISVGARPGDLTISPDGSTAYVLDSSVQKLFVVDLHANRVVATLTVAPSAESLAGPEPQP